MNTVEMNEYDEWYLFLILSLILKNMQKLNITLYVYLLAKELQSDRVTELQTPKGTQYTGGWIFFCAWFQ